MLIRGASIVALVRPVVVVVVLVVVVVVVVRELGCVVSRRDVVRLKKVIMVQRCACVHACVAECAQCGHLPYQTTPPLSSDACTLGMLLHWLDSKVVASALLVLWLLT